MTNLLVPNSAHASIPVAYYEQNHKNRSPEQFSFLINATLSFLPLCGRADQSRWLITFTRFFLQWPTPHFLPVWGREIPQLSMKRPKIMWEAFLRNFHSVFRFLPARSLDMTCALTSDQQFPSLRFRPRRLNRGVLTETSVTRYQRLDLQCWECVFLTHREAQSATVGSFQSK